ncbi:MAG: alpha/beta hydrolase [Gammaproteobacteria bacterium]|nr:MAG: alpha/beta hydrolase [Gammaproteobacteria bacterium]
MTMRRLFPVLGIIGIALLFAPLTGCAPDIGDSDAALLLEDVLAGTRHSRLKARTPAPTRRTIQYTIDDRQNIADLYVSPQGAQAGIVLIPGVVEDSKDDVRLIALANSLARLRFAVLVPEVSGLRRFHIRTSDVRIMADAFRYLVSKPELAPHGQAGFGGFSYGASIVLMASLETDIRNKVRYVLGFGGYHDMTNNVTYFTTGYYREEQTGTLKYRRPHGYPKKVFTISNSALLQSKADERALYELIDNKDPQRVAALIDKLSPRIKNELQGISPSNRDLSQIKAKVILLHGRGDTMIPYTESIALAQALPKDQVTLFLIEGYAHTDVKPERGDLPQLLGAMELLMQQRVE